MRGVGGRRDVLTTLPTTLQFRNVGAAVLAFPLGGQAMSSAVVG
jgi:hypothetical protein